MAMFRQFRTKQNDYGRRATGQSRRRPPQWTSRRNQRGVTITEALIATLIFSLSAGAVFSVFANGALQGQAVRDRTFARVRLESLLAEIDAACRFGPGDTQGDIDDRYAYRVSVSPYETRQSAQAAAIEAFEITAAVEWRTRGVPGSLALTTIRLGACGAADAG